MSLFHSDPPPVRLPLLTRAGSALTREIEVLDEYGDRRSIHIPDERPLTLYVDKRELVTLMTLGAEPELLALGYLRNQRLVNRVDEVLSITADWDVNAVAVRTRDAVLRSKSSTPARVRTATALTSQSAVIDNTSSTLFTSRWLRK